MKHLKQKLMAATAMLMVSAVMMTTSTYAWFAVSTAPEVAEISTSITGDKSLEIALGDDAIDDAPEDTTNADGSITDATQKDQTWGSTVTNVAFTTAISFPVSVSNGAFSTATYDATGRITGITQSLSLNTLTYADGEADVTANISVDGTTTTTSEVVASSTLLWLRSNVDISDVSIKVTSVTISTETDSDSTLTADDIGVAVKVASGSLQDVTVGEATALTGAFDAGEATTVEIYVYLKGDTVTNLDMSGGVTVTLGDIEFTSTTIGA